MYHLSEPTIAKGTDVALQRVLASNFFSPGPEVKAFEEEWAAYCGVKYGVACNSGTTAIEMAMVALQKRNRIIIPAFTCIPTAVPFIHAGYDLELVDCGSDGNVTAETLDKLPGYGWTFVPVHVYGNPVAPDVFALACEMNLTVVEDCAEAHGATVSGHFVGSQGQIGCFSFRGDKMITSGGVGGMCITNSEELAEYMRRYSLLFLTKPSEIRYDADGIGNGIQMSELQAAFGLCQIPMLDKLISVRRALAMVYDRELEKFNSWLMPALRPEGSVVWRYLVVLDEKIDRGQFIRSLNGEGVEAMWLMLQQDRPDDYVIATGESHTVGEFCSLAFACTGLDWQKYVVSEQNRFRPMDVNDLCGDAGKARRLLGWNNRVSFSELVKEMVDADLKRWTDYKDGKMFPWDVLNAGEI